MSQAAPITSDEMKRPLVHVPTNRHYRIAYEVAGTYQLESIGFSEKYATAAELRDTNIWRFA